MFARSYIADSYIVEFHNPTIRRDFWNSLRRPASNQTLDQYIDMTTLWKDNVVNVGELSFVMRLLSFSS